MVEVGWTNTGLTMLVNLEVWLRWTWARPRWSLLTKSSMMRLCQWKRHHTRLSWFESCRARDSPPMPTTSWPRHVWFRPTPNPLPHRVTKHPLRTTIVLFFFRYTLERFIKNLSISYRTPHHPTKNQSLRRKLTQLTWFKRSSKVTFSEALHQLVHQFLTLIPKR